MGIIAVNMKKIKASTNVNSLLGENYRTEKDAKKYDDGHRNIKTDKTVDNVFLIDRPENYDRERREKINRVNEARANRPNDDSLLLKKNLKKHGKLKSTNNKNIASHRKLRADTVDTIGEVVQPDADFINGLSHDDQIRFFSDALAVLRDNPDYFGKPETAVIHFDETTPHMQVLTSTIDEDNLTSNANKIMGNKTKMSKRQDVLADGLKAKGWDVERGMKRVDNPEYQNWKSEAEAKGFVVTRNNDRLLQQQMAQAEAEAAQKRREADKYLTGAKSSYGATTADLDVREQRVREKEEQVQRKSAAIQYKAKDVLDHEKVVNQAAVQVAEKGQKMDKFELKLNEKNEALTNREKILKAREDAIGGRESSLEARETVLGDKDRQASERFAEATKMRLMAEEKDKQADEKLSTAKNIQKQIENMKANLKQSWERVVEKVKRGALRPEVVEEHVKKYDPLTDDNMPDLTDSLNDLSDSVDNDNQINM